MPRKPSVTRRPVLTPLPSRSALVPTVVPWQKKPMSAAATPLASSISMPCRMAREGSPRGAAGGREHGAHSDVIKFLDLKPVDRHDGGRDPHLLVQMNAEAPAHVAVA